MTENIVPIPLPHQEREQILSPAHFLHALSERGWTVTHMRPAYTDLEVFRQQWLVCPNGARYPERTFYRTFGSTPFRKLLRYALSHVPCTRDVLEQVCTQQSVFSSSLTFLQDQEWFHFRDRWLEQGPYQVQISNIGRTLEWYVAEWFRLTVLRTVYTRAGVELTDPQESCKLEDIQIQSPGEQPCLGVRQ